MAMSGAVGMYEAVVICEAMGMDGAIWMKQVMTITVNMVMD